MKCKCSVEKRKLTGKRHIFTREKHRTEYGWQVKCKTCGNHYGWFNSDDIKPLLKEVLNA